MNIPEILYSWAYTPWHVAQCDRQSDSNLVLPGDYRWAVKSDELPEPALVHFASFYPDASERNWLWLFSDEQQAIRLRLLPEFATGSEADLIEATIPQSASNEPSRTYLQAVPRKWLRQLPLAENGITEIWYGFEHKRFIQDRRLEICAEKFSLEEFQERVGQAV